MVRTRNLCGLIGFWLVAVSIGHARPVGQAFRGAAEQAPDARTTIWDGVFTEVQAGRGQAAYGKSCGKCHAEDLLGSTNAPALVGQPFFARFDRTTADDVLDVIRRTMPQEAPDTLGMPIYADIVSYLFKANGAPAGQTELSTDRARLREILVASAK